MPHTEEIDLLADIREFEEVVNERKNRFNKPYVVRSETISQPKVLLQKKTHTIMKINITGTLGHSAAPIMLRGYYAVQLFLLLTKQN